MILERSHINCSGIFPTLFEYCRYLYVYVNVLVILFRRISWFKVDKEFHFMSWTLSSETRASKLYRSVSPQCRLMVMQMDESPLNHSQFLSRFISLVFLRARKPCERSMSLTNYILWGSEVYSQEESPADVLVFRAHPEIHLTWILPYNNIPHT